MVYLLISPSVERAPSCDHVVAVPSFLQSSLFILLPLYLDPHISTRPFKHHPSISFLSTVAHCSPSSPLLLT